MRKLCLLSILFFSQLSLRAQSVGINSDNLPPHASAMLDVRHSSKGVLIPRVVLIATDVAGPVSSPETSLLVYNTATDGSGGTAVTPGFYYWNGTSWERISSSSTVLNAWSLTGNAGTIPGINFIGTTDAQPLLFKVNNLLSGQIQPSNSNTAFGLQTLVNNQINGFEGTNNTAFGHWALYSNTSGYRNTAMGRDVLYSNTTGRSNTAVGSDALYSNTTGEANTAFGDATLTSNISGNFNTAIGDAALTFNTGGDANTATGNGALFLNTTGAANTATGYRALRSNTTGSINTANGYNALYSNTTGFQNTGIGYQTLYSNTTGFSNTAIGHQALYSNTGTLNTGSGYRSLFANTTGTNNTGAGTGSLANNTTGSYNTANGATALIQNITGTYNTASGFEALYSNSSGHFNTGIGYNTLRNTTSSQYNTAVGYNAGTNFNNGWNNVFIGANTDVDGNDYFNVIAIGQGTICTGSSQVTMGNSATGSYRAYANWSNISDGRYKKDVKENVPGLAFITKLRPVSYTLDAISLDNFLNKTKINGNQLSGKERTAMGNALKEREKIRQTGFVAQDVEKTAMELGFDFSGVEEPKNANDVYSLRYADFVVPLVKAIQEQQTIIEKQNDELKKLKEQVESLTKAVQNLSTNK